jgi:hypothetical protein
VRPLDLADLVVVASRTLGLEPAEVLASGEFDFADAEQVLAEAGRAKFLQRSAAVLLHGLVADRPFGRRSDEVALMAALQLLALNHYWIDELGPPGAVRTLLDRVAAGDADVDEVTAWLNGYRLETEEWLVVGSISMGRVGRLRRARRKEDRGTMFERFTSRARRVVVLAQEEARLLNHNYIGTEHLLLGLVREGEGVAAQVLDKLGADLPGVRQQVVQLLAGHAGAQEGAEAVEEDLEDELHAAIGGVFAENRDLRAEVRRLRELLRRHGIEPDGGESRSA